MAEIVNFDADNYKQNLVLQVTDTNQKIYVLVKDQFGKKIDNPAVSYESLDKTIALVDRTNGEITPLKEGSVPVRITVGDITRTIEIKVVEDAKAAAVELDKNEISISNQVNTPEKVEVTVKDQYDNVFNTSDNITVKVISGKDLVKVADTVSLTDGVGTLEVKPADNTKSGKAVIEIAVNEKVKATLEVEVTEAGIVDNYVVEGFKAELDKNAKAKEEEKTMTLSVFPVDANGVKTGDKVADAKYAIKNEDGKYLSKSENEVTWVEKENLINIENDIEASDFDEDKTYTLVIKVGTIEVFKDSFKVVDTTEKPVVEQIKSSITLEEVDVKEELKKAFKATLNEEKKDISDFTFVSDNTAVIDNAGNIKGEGTATLVVSKVTVDGKEIEVPNIMVNVTVDFDKLAVAPTNVTFTGTQVDGIEMKYSEGKVTISYDYASLPETIEQTPNEDLGADAKTRYVGMEIKAPEGATHVEQLGKIVKLGEGEATTSNARLFYIGFAKEGTDGKLSYLDKATIEKSFTWYDANENIVAITKIVIERPAYVAPTEDAE